jgi:hypothetical protein
MSKIFKPTSRNPGGGGVNSKKHVKTPVKYGSPMTRKVNVDVASNIGRSVGNHASDAAGGKDTVRPNQPMYKPTKAMGSGLGNEMAKNVGRGGPGAGRILHGQSGSQGTHDAVNPGSSPNIPLSSSGGPGGFGFKGGK